MSDPNHAPQGANEPTPGLTESSKTQPRRRFLATSGVAVASLAATTQPSKAFFFFGGETNLDLSDLPEQWVRSQEEQIQGYARYIAKLRLEKVTVQDVIKAHARHKGSVWNEIPPKNQWKAMGPSLQAADKLTVALGVDLKQICSAYRSPAYNARCPGAKPRSYHQKNIALDLIFNTSAGRVSRVARELRNNGLFKGGVGRYSLFTHIDTRGYNADW